MHLFPNPVTQLNEITITNTIGNEEFILFDLFGRNIPISKSFIEDNYRTIIKISNLSSGIYILKTNNKSWKIIIR